MKQDGDTEFDLDRFYEAVPCMTREQAEAAAECIDALRINSKKQMEVAKELEKAAIRRLKRFNAMMQELQHKFGKHSFMNKYKPFVRRD